MKKNLLKEQYARLFKGRVSSNDVKLIKENLRTDKNFKDEVSYIYTETGAGNNATDDIVDEMGDFYDDVYDSNDEELITAYDNLRSQVDESPEDQNAAAQALLRLLK